MRNNWSTMNLETFWSHLGVTNPNLSKLLLGCCSPWRLSFTNYECLQNIFILYPLSFILHRHYVNEHNLCNFGHLSNDIMQIIQIISFSITCIMTSLPKWPINHTAKYGVLFWMPVNWGFTLVSKHHAWNFALFHLTEKEFKF